ncbi:hypothetical protein E6H34_01970 [Candidatus Bathyarchaeota archaeon]|nr:MAG: hypothetical protein E6H34_01970 [Candidatus Bathyarchaeota archaeon]
MIFKTEVPGTQDYYAGWSAGKYVSEYNRTGIVPHNSGVLEMFVSELGSTGLVDNIYATSYLLEQSFLGIV